MMRDSSRKRWEPLSISTCILLAISSLAGVLSINFQNTYETMNQYGEKVLMYGSGIYAHDTYFKAPIQIGADVVALFLLVPLFLWIYNLHRTKQNDFSRMWIIATYAVILYYALSQALGVTYNRFHLLYIALVACALYGMFYHIHKWEGKGVDIVLTKGKTMFFIFAGIAVIVAWLPDIIPTLISGEPLAMIGVYTTEITYVLDMGIIGPACFVTIILLKQNDRIAPLLYTFILLLSFIIAIMVISGTVFQCLSGVEMTLPIVITKIGSFIVLGGFAAYFIWQLYCKEGNDRKAYH